VADLVHGARRRVRPHAQLAVDAGAHEDVLADREAQHLAGRRQREAEQADVAGQHRLGDEPARDLLFPRVGERDDDRRRWATDGGVLEVRMRCLLGAGGGDEQIADAVRAEEVLGLVGVDGVELLGAVGAGVDEDAVGAARVVLEILRAVVDVAVDDDPRRVLGRVLAHLGHGELIAGGVGGGRRRGGAAWWQRRWRRRTGGLRGLDVLLLRHPSARLVAGLHRVLERKPYLPVARPAHVNLHPEPAVGHHSLQTIKRV